VRQPEMEWKLSALREGADQDKEQRRQIKFAFAKQIARGKYPIEVIASDHSSDEENADQQAQPARGGHDQRNTRTAASGLVMVPVADQQEGKEAGELPEEDHLHQVARQHEAEHRAHER